MDGYDDRSTSVDRQDRAPLLQLDWTGTQQFGFKLHMLIPFD